MRLARAWCSSWTARTRGARWSSCSRRARAAKRAEAERFREEAKAGVVVRTATEVEARAAGLAPGAGAVVVGLARKSPWRAAGVRFGDLVVTVDGEPVAHPEVLMSALRTKAGPLRLGLLRDGARIEL
ncbi:MAG: PDZ domain-containing protein, partial [Planctomycetes bacterium]|nr:PDZ domain-containing protein [Planctomycetota bacterium]